MNVIQDNFAQTKRDLASNKPMIVKPTILGNALMQPPSSAVRKFVTPSSSRCRAKEGCQSSTTHSKSTPTVHRDSHIIVSVCEGRGKASGIVGIAAINIHRPILILSQISDIQTYTATLTKLNILRPVEVLVPATFIESAAPSRLITVIMNQFPNLSVTSIPRSEFNGQRGHHVIQNLCAPVFNSVVLEITRKFYASAASCALLKYIEQSRRVLYSPKTIKVVYQEPEHTTAIDIDTAELLELVSTTGKQNFSLFTVLNYCSTAPGKKLLRNNILQPPCRKTVIETRQDCVQELLENPTLLTRLQETLKPLSDIEASLTFGTVVPATASSVSERQLNYTLQLKGLLSAVQPLADELKATKHPVFRDIYYRIEGHDTRKQILSLISEIINEDAHLGKGQAGELQRCFAIKSGINGFLDLSRRLYTEEVDNMRSYVAELSQNYNLPLRVQHTIKSGFHIILPLSKALRNLKKTDLPPLFIKSERFSSHFYLTTMDMINFDKRLKNNSIEIQNISNVIIYKLLVDIRPHIGDLYHLCDDVAQLDMLVSLARASSIPNWVRPRLVDTHLNLEGARHPILEHVADQEPVANSIYAFPRCNLHIITGPNMSGKSILLQSLCLLQVLSQLGCYVPCSHATVRVCDKVFARVAEHDTSLIASSFALEMTKLSYLLTTLSDKSLVVLDELCKTTASDEGVAISMAVCEKMMKRGCFVYVASHFISITVLADMYPNVKNWHLEALEELRANNTRISLKFTYKLLPGVTSIDSYGIKISRIFNSSKSISDRAEDLYKYLLPLRKSLATEAASNNPDFLKFKLQAELDLLKIRNQLTDEIQKDKITNFQHKTGLSFEPSPLTIERSNSVLLDQTSSNDKKTSSNNSNSKEKKLSSDSNSWVPTPSNKSTVSSNHEFSIPTSNKSSSNRIQEQNTERHIFSFDNNDIIQRNEESNENNVSLADFSMKNPENNDQTFNFIPTGSKSNKNLLFFNSPDTQSNEFQLLNTNSFINDTTLLSQKTNWASAENTINKNNSNNLNLIVNSTPSNKDKYSTNASRDFNLMNINLSVDKTTLLSHETNFLSAENSFNNNSNNSNLIVNLTASNEDKTFTNTKRNDKLTTTNSTTNKTRLFSQKTNWSSAENTINNNISNSLNLIVNSTPSNKVKSSTITSRDFNLNNTNPSADKMTLFSQKSNCSSVENTINNNKLNNLNMMVNSTTSNAEKTSSNTNRDEKENPLTKSFSNNDNSNEINKNVTLQTPASSKCITINSCQENIAQTNSNTSIFSKMPLTASMFDVSSPILSRNFQKKQVIPNKISEEIPEEINLIPSQIRLVSHLYDTDSENSSRSEDDSLILNEENNREVFSPDELNFSTYLNLRQGLTSTPISTKKNGSEIIEINESTEYLTANSTENTRNTVLPPDTFIFNVSSLDSFQSSVHKRKAIPINQEFKQTLPEKLPKLNKTFSSSRMNTSNSSFRSCISSKATPIGIGRNVLQNIGEQVFEQDTIMRLNGTKNFSQSSKNAN